MTFLKVLGIVATVLGDLAGFGPIFQALGSSLGGSKGAAVATEVTNELDQIAQVVTTVETAFAATTSTAAQSGAQKLAAATPGVEAILQLWVSSGKLGSTKVKNQGLFMKASAEIAGGMADLLNSLEAPASVNAPSIVQVQASQEALRTVAATITGKA